MACFLAFEPMFWEVPQRLPVTRPPVPSIVQLLTIGRIELAFYERIRIFDEIAYCFHYASPRQGNWALATRAADYPS